MGRYVLSGAPLVRERSLERALRDHINPSTRRARRGDRRRVDALCLASPGMIVVVELKRPGKRVGREELRQLEGLCGTFFRGEQTGVTAPGEKRQVTGFLVYGGMRPDNEETHRSAHEFRDFHRALGKAVAGRPPSPSRVPGGDCASRAKHRGQPDSAPSRRSMRGTVAFEAQSLSASARCPCRPLNRCRRSIAVPAPRSTPLASYNQARYGILLVPLPTTHGHRPLRRRGRFSTGLVAGRLPRARRRRARPGTPQPRSRPTTPRRRC